MNKIVKRAIEILRNEGIASLWFRALGRTVYRRVIMMERPLDEPIVHVAMQLPVTNGLLQKTEIGEYLGFQLAMKETEVRRRLATGQWCFVTRHEGRIVNASWGAARSARIDYLDREIVLAPDQVYCYNIFTRPEYRGQDLAPMQFTHQAQFFRSAGYRSMLAVVLPENKPAFRPFEKAGFHRIGVMGYLRLGPWRHDFCRLNRGARPVAGKTT